MLDVSIAFAALLLLCLFLNQKCKITASVTPLASISVAMLWFSIAGICNFLVPMGWIFFAGVYALGFWAVADVIKTKKTELFSPGFCVFLGLGVVFLVYLAYRQPVVAVWDEMSFWGTAAKITKLDNTLYTISPLSQIWEWTATQKPGMIVLGYFMQFFGKGFFAWKLYFAYDLLLFACFGAVVGALEKSRPYLWVPTALIGFLSPWFFTVYQRETVLRPVYMDSYGDIPAGVLAAGAVAVWLCLRRTNSRGLWVVPVVLTAAMYVKDNTMPIALMAFGVVALDCFFFGLPQQSVQKKWKAFAMRGGFCACMIAAMGASYLLWNQHAAVAVQRHAQQGGLGNTSMALGAVLKNGVGMMVAPNSVSQDIVSKYGDKFAQVSADMSHAFWKVSITMAGSCFTVLILIAVLLAAAVVLTQRGNRLRTAVLGSSVLVGFFAYYLVILFSYVFVFKDFQAASLDSYNRYIYPYLLFAFLVIVALLADNANCKTKFEPTAVVLFGISGLMLWRFTTMLLPQFTVLGYPEPYFDEMKQSEQNAQAVTEAVPPQSRVFYVYQGDNGEHWFRQSYNLLPLITDPSGSVNEEKGWSGGMGGTFGLPELANGDIYYHPYTPEQLSSYLLENDCDYLYVEQSDEIFEQSYSHLFEDSLQNAQDAPALYQVQQKDGLAFMTLVETEAKK